MCVPQLTVEVGNTCRRVVKLLKSTLSRTDIAVSDDDNDYVLDLRNNIWIVIAVSRLPCDY